MPHSFVQQPPVETRNKENKQNEIEEANQYRTAWKHQNVQALRWIAQHVIQRFSVAQSVRLRVLIAFIQHNERHQENMKQRERGSEYYP